MNYEKVLNSFTSQARKALDRARDEAKNYGHAYVGTEHLLLGVLMEDEAGCAHVLASFGADVDRIRNEIERLIQRGPTDAISGELPLTPRAKQAVEFAAQSAMNLSQTNVGTENLLVGLMREADGVGAQVLRSLGLRNVAVIDQLLKIRLAQIKIVERAVRPVRASITRKRRMREELLAHLTEIYDEEVARTGNAGTATPEAEKRFGDLGQLTRELESSLPPAARREYYIERWFGWRAPETATRWMFRLATQLFLFLAAVCGIGWTAAIAIVGWENFEWRDLRVVPAIVLLVPATVFLLGSLFFQLRDAMFGVFGSRKSLLRVMLLDVLIALVVVGSATIFAVVVELNRLEASKMLASYAVAGVVISMMALVIARLDGPEEIRDTIWECLDVNEGDGETPAAAS